MLSWVSPFNMGAFMDIWGPLLLTVRSLWRKIRKPMPLTFVLSLTLHVPFLKKLKVPIRIVLVRAFDHRLARPSATPGSGYNRG